MVLNSGRDVAFDGELAVPFLDVVFPVSLIEDAEFSASIWPTWKSVFDSYIWEMHLLASLHIEVRPRGNDLEGLFS